MLMFLTKLNEVLASHKPWKSFVSDRLNFFSLGVAFLLNIIQWAVIFIKLKPSGQNILLHFNVIYGADLVDLDYYAYLVPGIALLFLLVNGAAALFIYQREKLASYFLGMANLPVQMVFLVAAIVLAASNN